jgi:hypothetical protein
VLETRKLKLGPEHPDTLTSMNHLSPFWKAQGRLTEALDLLRSCHRSEQKKLGPNHPYTLSTSEALKRWERESRVQVQDEDEANDQELSTQIESVDLLGSQRFKREKRRKGGSDFVIGFSLFFSSSARKD